MTLEEAQAKITELNKDIQTKDGEIAGLNDKVKNAGKELSEDDMKKIEQKFYNQGFDKAKNQFEDDKKDYLKKDDVDKMLSDRDSKYRVKTELLKIGALNPEKAFVNLSEDEIASIGTDDFKLEDFKANHADDIVFKTDDKGQPPKNITKDNKKPKQTVTADSYKEMSPSEKAKMSSEDKLALLRA